MTIRALTSMFKPHSIAIIGQSGQDDDPATLLLRNLLDAGFKGPVLPVNPERHAVAGVLAYRDVASLPEAPELAITTTPLAKGPALIDALGAKGTRAVLLLSNERLNGCQDDETLKQALLAAAKPYQLRMLGPDRLGMAIPVNGINATLSRTPLLPGAVSVVAQSSSLLRTIIHWGHLSTIGFSHLVSLGGRVDVDCSDVLDYLAWEPQTRAILLYLENVPNPRRFMSAARSAARLKPVIVLKPQTAGESAMEEAIYDAAFRRAGLLRVDTIEHLFNAVKALAGSKVVRNNRLLILGNSHGIGLLAADRLTREGGTLAPISAATGAELDRLAPPGCQAGNPVDLGSSAGFKEYDRALELLLKEPEVDGILIVHVPVSPDLDRECGQAIIARTARSDRLVMVSWVGATATTPVWQSFQQVRLPIYGTPEEAVWSFLQMAAYRRNQELLMETPPSIPAEFIPATAAARGIISAALAAGKEQLDVEATRELLAAYRIPMVNTQFARTPEDAAALAERLDGGVALKILSAGITNRSDVGGVALALEHNTKPSFWAFLIQCREVPPPPLEEHPADDSPLVNGVI